MTEENTAPDLATGNGWLEMMDLVIGEEVMIIPAGSNGGGFQGNLVDVIFGQLSPLLVVIEKPGSPRCTVNWANVSMITRVAVGVPVSDTPIGGGQALQIADLEEMADRIGIDIPDEVRKLMDTSGA